MKEDLGSFMEIARIQGEINRLFDNLLDLRSADARPASGKWVPNADVLETREQLVVRFELPGVDPADVSLAVAGGDLILSGEKPARRPEPGARLHASERGCGGFRRVIHIGASTNPHQATAELKDGLLTVCLPKVPNRRGEEVRIALRQEAGVHGQ